MGELIYLQNPSVELTSSITSNKPKTDLKEDPKAKCAHSSRETCINCIDKIKQQKEDEKVISTTNKEDSKKTDPKANCHHSALETCINCIDHIRKIQEEKKQEEIKKKELEKARQEFKKVDLTTKQKKEQEMKDYFTNLKSDKERAGISEKCNHSVGQKCLHCMQAPVVSTYYYLIIRGIKI